MASPVIEEGTQGWWFLLLLCLYINTNVLYSNILFFRHGAIQTRGQMEVIREFEQYLKPFRIIFALE